jgi:hypothetical protein
MATVTAFMGGFELGTYLYNYMIEHNYDKFGYQNSDPSSSSYYEKHLVNFIDLGKPAS